jgi:hypothetical protein
VLRQHGSHGSILDHFSDLLGERMGRQNELLGA